jgi:MFS family permease
MWVVAKGEPLYLLIFYASLVSRLMLTTFTQFYLLWITSQAARPGETPRPEQMSREDALSLYTNATLTGMVLTLILMPLAGYMSDKVGFEWQLSFSFGVRMSAIIGFLFLKDANNGLAYLISVVVLVFTNMENVFVYALFAKKLPGDIRASMQGLLASVC